MGRHTGAGERDIVGEQPTDGDFQDALEWARLQLTEWGFFKTRDGLRWATAYGLVRSVWRNGPIENAHASRPTSRREALHDGTMFARDTWFTRQAFDVLGSDDQFRLYELEDLVLDRDQVWPGCEGPVHLGSGSATTTTGCRDGLPAWKQRRAACAVRTRSSGVGVPRKCFARSAGSMNALEEGDTDPRGQITQPPLHGLGLGQDRVDRLRRGGPRPARSCGRPRGRGAVTVDFADAVRVFGVDH